MELNKDLENKIKVKAIYYMSKSRPGWNIPHLHTAVYYIKKLIAKEGGNKKILLPAIYLHDIGYFGELTRKYSYEDNEKVKKSHMITGAIMSRKILKELNAFSDFEIKEISRLVSIHDNMNKIKDKNSQLIFEADSLAQIDIKRVKPNFNKENYLKFIKKFKEKRVPKFKTKTGKKYLKKFLPKIESYYN